MALNFPGSPTAGQTSQQNGRTYVWNPPAWELVASPASDSRWDLFLPPAPTGLTATAGNASASLSWTAPTVLAQTSINDYREQFSTDGGTTWTTFSAAASTATTATVTGLTNGTAYRFRVAAVNSVGVGAYTAASAAVTPGVPSDALFANVALLLHGDGNIADSSSFAKTLSTTGTVSTDGAPRFGSASLAFSGSGRLVVPSDSTLTFSGDFTIEMFLQFSTKPDNYIALFAGSSGATQMFLTTKVDGNGIRWGLSAVAEYASGDFTWATGTWYHVAVRRASNAVTLWVNGNNITSGSPTNSLTYSGGMNLFGGIGSVTDFTGLVDEFRVTQGVARTITVPTAACPDVGPMSAPTSLTATGGNAQVSLTWTAPSYNGGSAITDYSVQFSSDSGSTWTTVSRTASTTASQVVSALTNGTAYVFRVAGINSNGTGTYTAASSSVTPADGLSAPVLTRTGCSDGTVSYSWTTIASATTYRLQANGNNSSSLGTWADVQANSSTGYSGDTGSSPGQWFRVRAENATMQSAYSSPVQAGCAYSG